MATKIAMIYARSSNHCIGKDGGIPWHLPDDFAHFKKTTMGKPIIMGRKTYEDHQSALPGRLNIVVTRQQNYQVVEGIEVVSSLDAAIKRASEASNEIFIIGGVEFFTLGYAIADTVYETIIEADIDGDAFLPAFDYSDWESELLDEHPIDDKHKFAFKFYKHCRL